MCGTKGCCTWRSSCGGKHSSEEAEVALPLIWSHTRKNQASTSSGSIHNLHVGPQLSLCTLILMFPKYKNQISTEKKKERKKNPNQQNKQLFCIEVDWAVGGERFIPAVKLENGYKPQQSVCVLGPREANCLFVLRVYGLSAAQLTGNLNLKEAAHQSPLSASCAHTRDRARQRGSSHTQPIPEHAVLWDAPGMQRKEGGKSMDSPPLSSPPS